MFRRDQRFIPEMHSIGVRGYVRIVALIGISAASFFGVIKAGQEFYVGLRSDGEAEVVMLDPIKQGWKRKPEDAGGIEFLNKGLEINTVQAELFDIPSPEEIVLAPPPADF